MLGDVLETFRNDSLRNYALCVSHYFRAPALNWNAMLNLEKVELALISYVDLFLFFEESMRDGVSYFSKECSKTISM